MRAQHELTCAEAALRVDLISAHVAARDVDSATARLQDATVIAEPPDLFDNADASLRSRIHKVGCASSHNCGSADAAPAIERS